MVQRTKKIILQKFPILITKQNCNTKVGRESNESIRKTRRIFKYVISQPYLNGKIENKSMNLVSSEVSYKNSGIKNFRQHKVTLIGDSFLKELRRMGNFH
jgi:hypothetical protein